MKLSFRYWKPIAAASVVVALLVPFGHQYYLASEYARVSTTIVRQPVSIDPQLLAACAGTYQLKPGFEVEVTVIDGRLFTQATNQARIEFYPASSTIFYNELTPLLMVFERNEAGALQQFRVLEPGRSRLAVRIDSLAPVAR